MIQLLYRGIVRLHPQRFRDQFGDQMLSTFEDAIRERSGVLLLLDGLVSLCRQWWKPSNWFAPGRAVVPPTVSAEYLKVLRKRSDEARRHAWKVNLIWIPLLAGSYGWIASSVLHFPSLPFAFFLMVVALVLVTIVGKGYLKGLDASGISLSLRPHQNRLLELREYSQRIRAWSRCALLLVLQLAALECIEIFRRLADPSRGAISANVVATFALWLAGSLILLAVIAAVNWRTDRVLQAESDAIHSSPI